MNDKNTVHKEHYQEDEIDIKEILGVLLENKWFIFWFTALVVILSIIISFNLTPKYKATISFLSPDKTSILLINKYKITSETSETSETLYKSFLDKYKSTKYQQKIFNSYKYLDRFYPRINQADNIQDLFFDAVQSFRELTTKIKKNEKSGISEQPATFILEGKEPDTISAFLSDLAQNANADTVKELFGIIDHKINIRLNEISRQRALLLAKVKIDRLAQIIRIKIEDQQKTDEINDSISRLRVKAKKNRVDEIKRIEALNNQRILEVRNQIDRLRVKAKKDRLNRVTVLSDNLNIARKLGMKHNNFGYTGDNTKTNSSTLIEVNSNKKQPKWFLYGEDALLEEISVLQKRKNDDPYISEITALQNKILVIQSDQNLQTLKNRSNDDPYIPEIANLQNKIKQINSNRKLQTLKNRTDDSPFVADEINTLEVEAIKLKALVFDTKGVNAMRLNRRAYSSSTPIEPQKKRIVAIAFIAALLLSIIIVFIRNMLNREP